MTIKIALPTGDARAAVGEMMQHIGLDIEAYRLSSRQLRATVAAEDITVRVFRERDIPIQVALGNYHLGICSDVWLSELQARFPLQRLVRVGSLPGPRSEVWLCAAEGSGAAAAQMPPGPALSGARIATELPNMADLVATHTRIPGYHLISAYGSADAYAPEDAELVLLPVADAAGLRAKGMVPLHRLLAGGMALVANGDALAGTDLGRLLARLAPVFEPWSPQLTPRPARAEGPVPRRFERRYDVARLALPDGHAQPHTYAALKDAGLEFDGYDEKRYVRRPMSGISGLEVKVIRPQDMPSLVATGAFDVAVTGVDRLNEHLALFPASPVQMTVDLGRSRYKIGPVVDRAFPADDTTTALGIWRNLGRPVRIASEFPALAEAFARDHHLVYTTIIPINGASEAFVPEDADILIEGSETGTSIRANGLKMLDPFLESTNCVVTRKEPVTERTDVVAELLERFRLAARAIVPA
jgi:ATP phosphoribosyltransferase